MPAREEAAGEEGFGGPFAEVDGESDAVAVVAGEDHHLLAARVVAEDGQHFFGEENRAAPAVRDAHGGKGRVQMADAAFEPAETLCGFAPANIVPLEGKPLRGKPLDGKPLRGKPLGGKPLRGKPA